MFKTCSRVPLSAGGNRQRLAWQSPIRSGAEDGVGQFVIAFAFPHDPVHRPPAGANSTTSQPTRMAKRYLAASTDLLSSHPNSSPLFFFFFFFSGAALARRIRNLDSRGSSTHDGGALFRASGTITPPQLPGQLSDEFFFAVVGATVACATAASSSMRSNPTGARSAVSLYVHDARSIRNTTGHPPRPTPFADKTHASFFPKNPQSSC